MTAEVLNLSTDDFHLPLKTQAKRKEKERLEHEIENLKNQYNSIVKDTEELRTKATVLEEKRKKRDTKKDTIPNGEAHSNPLPRRTAKDEIEDRRRRVEEIKARYANKGDLQRKASLPIFNGQNSDLITIHDVGPDPFLTPQPVRSSQDHIKKPKNPKPATDLPIGNKQEKNATKSQASQTFSNPPSNGSESKEPTLKSPKTNSDPPKKRKKKVKKVGSNLKSSPNAAQQQETPKAIDPIALQFASSPPPRLIKTSPVPQIRTQDCRPASKRKPNITYMTPRSKEFYGAMGQGVSQLLIEQQQREQKMASPTDAKSFYHQKQRRASVAFYDFMSNGVLNILTVDEEGEGEEKEKEEEQRGKKKERHSVYIPKKMVKTEDEDEEDKEIEKADEVEDDDDDDDEDSLAQTMKEWNAEMVRRKKVELQEKGDDVSAENLNEQDLVVVKKPKKIKKRGSDLKSKKPKKKSDEKEKEKEKEKDKKIKKEGSVDKIKKDGSLEKIKKEGSLEKIKKEGSLEKIKKEGSLDNLKDDSQIKKVILKMYFENGTFRTFLLKSDTKAKDLIEQVIKKEKINVCNDYYLYYKLDPENNSNSNSNTNLDSNSPVLFFTEGSEETFVPFKKHPWQIHEQYGDRCKFIFKTTPPNELANVVKKKKKRKLRRVYFDVMISDLDDLEINLENKKNHKIYCRINYKEQRFKTNLIDLNEHFESSSGAPVIFNDCLTFTTFEGEVQNLYVKLYCTTGGRLAKEEYVGTAIVPLPTINDNLLHDMWVYVKQAVRTETTAYEQTKGSLHLLVQRCVNHSTGMFGGFGVPVPSLPVRLDIGDTILFRSSTMVSHGTKLATRSKWDHAAIVVKLEEKKSLSLFEATRDGVKLYPLSLRLEFYLQTTKLGVRKLCVKRTKNMLKSLDDFMIEVSGRPYKMNPVELGRAVFTKTGNAQDNLDNIFCSQLVAAAYQRMGILSTSKAASNYLPSDLASKSFNLLKGNMKPLMVIPKTHNVKHK